LKAAANETEGWRKEIGEAMARKRAEAPHIEKEEEKKATCCGLVDWPNYLPVRSC